MIKSDVHHSGKQHTKKQTGSSVPEVAPILVCVTGTVTSGIATNVKQYWKSGRTTTIRALDFIHTQYFHQQDLNKKKETRLFLGFEGPQTSELFIFRSIDITHHITSFWCVYFVVVILAIL